MPNLFGDTVPPAFLEDVWARNDNLMRNGQLGGLIRRPRTAYGSEFGAYGAYVAPMQGGVPESIHDELRKPTPLNFTPEPFDVRPAPEGPPAPPDMVPQRDPARSVYDYLPNSGIEYQAGVRNPITEQMRAEYEQQRLSVPEADRAAFDAQEDMRRLGQMAAEDHARTDPFLNSLSARDRARLFMQQQDDMRQLALQKDRQQHRESMLEKRFTVQQEREFHKLAEQQNLLDKELADGTITPAQHAEASRQVEARRVGMKPQMLPKGRSQFPEGQQEGQSWLKEVPGGHVLMGRNSKGEEVPHLKPSEMPAALEAKAKADHMKNVMSVAKDLQSAETMRNSANANYQPKPLTDYLDEAEGVLKRFAGGAQPQKPSGPLGSAVPVGGPLRTPTGTPEQQAAEQELRQIMAQFPSGITDPAVRQRAEVLNRLRRGQ